MKQRKLKLACAAVSVSIAAFGLLGAAWRPETAVVKELLEKRTDIMENVLTGKITYEEGKQQLKDVETGALYRRDLESLRAYADTDVDRVQNMRIISIEKKSHIYDIMTFYGELSWTCYGYEGLYTQMGTYQISVMESEEEYKLISLEAQQK